MSCGRADDGCRRCGSGKTVPRRARPKAAAPAPDTTLWRTVSSAWRVPAHRQHGISGVRCGWSHSCPAIRHMGEGGLPYEIRSADLSRDHTAAWLGCLEGGAGKGTEGDLRGLRGDQSGAGRHAWEAENMEAAVALAARIPAARHGGAV